METFAVSTAHVRDQLLGGKLRLNLDPLNRSLLCPLQDCKYLMYRIENGLDFVDQLDRAYLLIARKEQLARWACSL